MTKEYFQDIVPPTQSTTRPKERIVPDEEIVEEEMAPLAERSGIRSISVSRTRQRMSGSRIDEDSRPQRPRGSFGVPSWVLMLGAGMLVFLVGGFFFFAFRKTTITVTPRTQSVTFDKVTPFTAYPSTATTTGVLAYVVQTRDIEESQSVSIPKGTQPQEPHKASGSVTIVNNYSSQPVTLVKNTRFSTPEGLIFRSPSNIVVPGKKGSQPGTVAVTLISDEDGAQYNVGPISQFSLPGLAKGSPMYGKVYAKSTTPMTDGADAGAGGEAIRTAVIELHTKLQKQAADVATSLTGTTTIVFPDLIKITYQDAPAEVAADGSAKVTARAHLDIPVFPKDSFSKVVAQLVAADTETGAFSLIGGADYGAHFTDATSTTLGTDPIAFTMQGAATLVWQLDADALAKALAGRNESSFHAITSGFPAIQEAHARIEPFWNNSFPKDPKNIVITIKGQPESR